jgi:hypothetical protein
MDNKLIGIVIGVLILGVVIFSGINNPEMSKGLNIQDKIKSTGLTNPEVIQTSGALLDSDCPGGIIHVQQGYFHGGGFELQCIGDHGNQINYVNCAGTGTFDIYDSNGNIIGTGC